ncbi:MAG: hypothetical protein RL653_1268 [Pseudomonadota bacterium]|jgi:hypothetical protein
MNVVTVYARLYADCLAKALAGIRKNPWTLLLPVGLVFVGTSLGALLGGVLGSLVGGLLVSLLLDALYSAYLYFVAGVVQQTKVSVKEIRQGLGAYFFSIMNVLFVIYLTDLVLGTVLQGNPQRWVIESGVKLVEAVLFSAVPEVLYQRHTYGMQSLLESVKFVQENWIEWFLPQGLLLAAVYAVGTVALGSGLGLLLVIGPGSLLGGALLHLFMVFRGHLFDALATTSHRQRMFRYRGLSP